jgi:hypothetical protein
LHESAIIAFEKIHNGQPAPTRVAKQPEAQAVYTDVHEARFHARAKQLFAAALSSSYIEAPRSGVFEIVVPTETAEELIEALRRSE